MLVQAGAGNQAYFRKRSVAIVVEQETRRRVVGHEDVHPTVVIVVPESDSERFPFFVRYAGLLGDIRKCAVSIVPEQYVRYSLEIVRMAVGSIARHAVAAVA